MKLLLVEDEEMIAEAVAQMLKKDGYSVDIAADGEYGLDCLLSGIYDIAVLDIMLPKMDGIALLKQARTQGIDIPILMLTAKGELMDRVEGLNSGADDYLGKPFQYEELIARLRALGRRKSVYHEDGLLTAGDIILNPYTCVLTKEEQAVKLTNKEAAILEILIANHPKLSTKEGFIEKIWGFDSEAEDKHVEIHISLLRKKLKEIHSDTQIKVIRRLGYLLEFPTR
ncbi:response regulator transcription factor [Enterococcus sp. BWR-S5]|uniref:response regulator transcription factor n=1 Tax=Enterococcus sp. BWR-S5 TaxID=2787714 RepID=UPI0019208B82|nr:response regulator transcription factor [Enterococcus sp. BWR-S5]MBL1224071.1 response regulator transcription factor [Enterococcus sp. BWR-S5]